jgi:uncharacterized protein (TIGR03118 family)
MWLDLRRRRRDSKAQGGVATKARRGREFGRRVVETLEGRALLSSGMHAHAHVHIQAVRPGTTLFTQTNLVSDGAIPAQVVDHNLVNSWGVTFKPAGTTPGGPFWVANNGTGVASLYRVDPTTNVPTTESLVVKIPAPASAAAGTISAPTGIVFNPNNASGSTAFTVTAGGKSGPAAFIFVTEDGTISGWNPTVNPTNAILAVDQSAQGSVFKGAALATANGQTFLYVTDFHNRVVDVFDSGFHLVSSFADPRVPRDYAPFGIQNVDGTLLVTYAKQTLPAAHDQLNGPGHGGVDAFSPIGQQLLRVASHGPLNSPWGVALAPSSFGTYANDLLVGNHGDGRINAYRPVFNHQGTLTRFAPAGPLRNSSGKPIVIDGLWSLNFGNGGAGGNPNILYFSSGPNGEANGLFGSLQPVTAGSGGSGGSGGSPTLVVL